MIEEMMEKEKPSEMVILLNQARSGDQESKDRLFELCRNYVSIIARAQIGTWLQAKVDPSDLVQQTLLDAHRGIHNFRGASEGEWLAWLRQILNNNTTDYIRKYRGTEKRQINREVSIEQTTSGGSVRRIQPQADCDTPSQIVLQREQEVNMANAISKLSNDYQQVIILRNLQRLSFNEVAENMDRTRPAVQMLWMRAIEQLKGLMDVGMELKEENE